MRIRLACLPVVALLLLLRAHSSANEKIVLGYSGVGSGEEVHHFAKEVGLFKKHNLDPTLVFTTGGSTRRRSPSPRPATSRSSAC